MAWINKKGTFGKQKFCFCCRGEAELNILPLEGGVMWLFLLGAMFGGCVATVVMCVFAVNRTDT